MNSNRFRPPAMLAKIAATADIVSAGWRYFGIGAGSRPSQPSARREYEAHGLPSHDFPQSVDGLDEALTVIRQLWAETERFDFQGSYVTVIDASGNPKPLPPRRRVSELDVQMDCRLRSATRVARRAASA